MSLLLALLLSASTQPQEWLGRFHAACLLTAPGGEQTWAPCLSEDLPDPSLENRWHYVLGPATAKLLVLRRGALYARHTVCAVPGGMVHEIEGFVRLDFHPVNSKVHHAFTVASQREPRCEVLYAWVTTRLQDHGFVEILFEEDKR